MKAGVISAFKFVNQAAAVDVEGLENIEDLLDRNVPIEGPEDNVEVFLAGFKAIQDPVEKELTLLKPMLKKTEIATIQLDPKALSLQMLEPACPQIAVPVLLHPATNGCFAEVVADFF